MENNGDNRQPPDLSFDTVGDELFKRFPQFKALSNEDDEDDKDIPNVLFGDFARYVIGVNQSSKTDPEAEGELTRCLGFIESLVRSRDPQLSELAVTGFLENIQSEDGYDGIKDKLSAIEAYRKSKLAEGGS